VKCEGLEIATCLQYLVQVKESPRHTNCPHPLIPTTIPQPPASNLNSPLCNMFDLLNMFNLLLGLVALLFQLAFALALSAAGIITFLYIHSLIPRAPTPLELLEARIKGPSPSIPFPSTPTQLTTTTPNAHKLHPHLVRVEIITWRTPTLDNDEACIAYVIGYDAQGKAVMVEWTNYEGERDKEVAFREMEESLRGEVWLAKRWRD
jgi:hypothetical protein